MEIIYVPFYSDTLIRCPSKKILILLEDCEQQEININVKELKRHIKNDLEPFLTILRIRKYNKKFNSYVLLKEDESVSLTKENRNIFEVDLAKIKQNEGSNARNDPTINQNITSLDNLIERRNNKNNQIRGDPNFTESLRNSVKESYTQFLKNSVESCFPYSSEIAFLYACPALFNKGTESFPSVKDFYMFDYEREIVQIRDFIANFNCNIKMICRHATWKNFIEVIRSKPKVLHILCHGEPDENKVPKVYNLFLENEKCDGSAIIFNHKELNKILQEYKSCLKETQLIFINSCYSQTIGEEFKNACPNADIVSVKSTYTISEIAAREFSSLFYSEIGQKIPPENAFRNCMFDLNLINKCRHCCCSHPIHTKDCKHGRLQAIKNGNHKNSKHFHSSTCLNPSIYKYKNICKAANLVRSKFIYCSCMKSFCDECSHNENKKECNKDAKNMNCKKSENKEDCKNDGEIFENPFDYQNCKSRFCLAGNHNEISKYIFTKTSQKNQKANEPIFGENKFGTVNLIRECNYHFNLKIKTDYLQDKKLIIYQILSKLSKETIKIVNIFGSKGSGKSSVAKYCVKYICDRNIYKNNFLYIKFKKKNILSGNIIQEKISKKLFKDKSKQDFLSSLNTVNIIIILNKLDLLIENKIISDNFTKFLGEFTRNTGGSKIIIISNSNLNLSTRFSCSFGISNYQKEEAEKLLDKMLNENYFLIDKSNVKEVKEKLLKQEKEWRIKEILTIYKKLLENPNKKDLTLFIKSELKSYKAARIDDKIINSLLLDSNKGWRPYFFLIYFKEEGIYLNDLVFIYDYLIKYESNKQNYQDEKIKNKHELSFILENFFKKDCENELLNYLSIFLDWGLFEFINNLYNNGSEESKLSICSTISIRSNMLTFKWNAKRKSFLIEISNEFRNYFESCKSKINRSYSGDYFLKSYKRYVKFFLNLVKKALFFYITHEKVVPDIYEFSYALNSYHWFIKKFSDYFNTPSNQRTHFENCFDLYLRLKKVLYYFLDSSFFSRFTSNDLSDHKSLNKLINIGLIISNIKKTKCSKEENLRKSAEILSKVEKIYESQNGMSENFNDDLQKILLYILQASTFCLLGDIRNLDDAEGKIQLGKEIISRLRKSNEKGHELNSYEADLKYMESVILIIKFSSFPSKQDNIITKELILKCIEDSQEKYSKENNLFGIYRTNLLMASFSFSNFNKDTLQNPETINSYLTKAKESFITLCNTTDNNEINMIRGKLIINVLYLETLININFNSNYNINDIEYMINVHKNQLYDINKYQEVCTMYNKKYKENGVNKFTFLKASSFIKVKTNKQIIKLNPLLYPSLSLEEEICNLLKEKENIKVFFGELSKANLQQVSDTGTTILHIYSKNLSENFGIEEKEIGTAVEMDFSIVKNIYKDTKYNIDILILASFNSNKIVQKFINLNIAKSIISFDFTDEWITGEMGLYKKEKIHMEAIYTLCSKFYSVFITSKQEITIALMEAEKLMISKILQILKQFDPSNTLNINDDKVNTSFKVYLYYYVNYSQGIYFSDIFKQENDNKSQSILRELKYIEINKGAIEKKVYNLSVTRCKTNIYKSNDCFIGHNRLICKLIYLLLKGQNINLFGEPGIGKTRLAQELGYFLHQRGEFLKGIFYFDLKNYYYSEAKLVDDLRKTGILDEDLNEINGLSTEPSSRNNKNKRGLIILDNCDILRKKYFLNFLNFTNFSQITFILISDVLLLNLEEVSQEFILNDQSIPPLQSKYGSLLLQAQINIFYNLVPKEMIAEICSNSNLNLNSKTNSTLTDFYEEISDRLNGNPYLLVAFAKDFDKALNDPKSPLTSLEFFQFSVKLNYVYRLSGSKKLEICWENDTALNFSLIYDKDHLNDICKIKFITKLFNDKNINYLNMNDINLLNNNPTLTKSKLYEIFKCINPPESLNLNLNLNLSLNDNVILNEQSFSNIDEIPLTNSMIVCEEEEEEGNKVINKNSEENFSPQEEVKIKIKILDENKEDVKSKSERNIQNIPNFEINKEISKNIHQENTTLNKIKEDEENNNAMPQKYETKDGTKSLYVIQTYFKQDGENLPIQKENEFSKSKSLNSSNLDNQVIEKTQVNTFEFKKK